MPCGRDIQTCPRTYQIGIKEAIVAAKFQKDYWNLKDGRPGLVRVKAKLPEATAEEIPSLVRAVQAAHTDYLLIVDPKVLDLGERAREVHDELESVIEFLLDDGVEEPADQQLKALKRFDADAGEKLAGPRPVAEQLRWPRRHTDAPLGRCGLGVR